MEKRVYFAVHGTVQGVGFRYFTRQKAREHGITGWCRNTIDNTVEGEVQGDEARLSAFFKDIDVGPSHARVSHVVKDERDVIQGDDHFHVRH